jgi:hypothetical protein
MYVDDVRIVSGSHHTKIIDFNNRINKNLDHFNASTFNADET